MNIELKQHSRIQGELYSPQMEYVYSGINTTEIINSPYYKFNKNKAGYDSFSKNINIYDEHGNFHYSRKIPAKSVIEFLIPTNYCLKNVLYDHERIDFLLLYSTKSDKLRYIFYVKENMQVEIKAVCLKDVYEILQNIKIADIGSTLRKKIEGSVVIKLAGKKERLRKNFGNFIRAIEKGEINTITDFETELKKISKHYTLTKRSKTYLFKQKTNKINNTKYWTYNQSSMCSEIAYAFSRMYRDTVTDSTVKKYWNHIKT
ncbi:MAG: hypothetical protein CL670_00650 [Balneola sp.]|jgi:hypothetical protein|nr:hypothetical protein [Balneola sp.]MBE77642.1 hypothetical protein [Balneola sp.]|tara:strand:+ start:14063 stop:14842 length:780 start_codon:yes stop_codon:yes gene_type:complete